MRREYEVRLAAVVSEVCAEDRMQVYTVSKASPSAYLDQ